MYTPIHSAKVFERIAEQIEQQILRGDLRNGDRLPTERELAERFHVSRTAVREAMKALAQKGLVDMRPGRGTIVIDGTSQALRNSLGLMLRVGHPESARDLVEVREILEPEIAALAAARACEQDIIDLQTAVDLMDSNIADVDGFISADNDFHRILARATQNVLIIPLMEPIMSLLSEQRQEIFGVDGGPQRGQIHHKEVLEAVRHHDPDVAREAMRAHLRQVRTDVAAALTYAVVQRG